MLGLLKPSPTSLIAAVLAENPPWLQALLDRLPGWAQNFIGFVLGYAGGWGLFVIAFVDSSFGTLPVINDALVIALSLQNPERMPYFQLMRRRAPTLQNKFNQLRQSGVTLVTGTDSGIPMNFHFDSTWRELDTFVRLGLPPMEAIRAATYWPAKLLKRDDLGLVAPGKLADVIVVDGDPLRSMESLRHVVHVIKDGVVYK